jgi:acyl-coenzyme A thioesterase PaaI-like protein
VADSSQFTEMEWIQFLGIEALSAEEGRAVIRLRPQSVHLNHNGTVNAPILYGLAEVAGAGAVVAGMLEVAAVSYTVVSRASIEYHVPARGVVVATGSITASAFAEVVEEVSAGRPSEVEVPVVITDEGET